MLQISDQEITIVISRATEIVGRDWCVAAQWRAMVEGREEHGNVALPEVREAVLGSRETR